MSRTGTALPTESASKERTMSTIERAVAIAAEAHAGQTDKAGAPYLLHPLRVMLSVSKAEERIVAVLHDVLEDCPGWTLDRLRADGFSEVVLAGLVSVTKTAFEEAAKDEASYLAFVRRAAANPIGRVVKLADLRDNFDLSRIAAPTDRDRLRLKKYERAIALLESLA
jgi:(p)ppGpp synthase/HD superfamily hydrolase